MILDTFIVTAPTTLSKADWKSPGVHEGQLLLAEPKPERPGYLGEEACDYDPSIDFGVNVERGPWTAALLLKDTVVPQELTIKRAYGSEAEKYPRHPQQKLPDVRRYGRTALPK